jgi:hypothetical protein
MSDRRREWAAILVLLLAASFSAALILYLGRHLTFFHDEWSFLTTRTGWTLDDFMRPHNEHWPLGLAIPWKILLATVGMRSYLPYLGLTIVVHLIAAAAVYVLVRTQAGRAIGVIFTVVFLFLGAGGEDLFWAFQAGFIGGSAAGAWAMAILLARPPHHRRANIAVAILLLVAVATHGPGLFFLGAVGVTIVAVPSRRRQWPVLAPAVVAYAVWYLIWGRGGVEPAFGQSLLMPEILFEYVKLGLSTAMGTILGVGPELGLIVVALIIAAAAWRYIRNAELSAAAVAGASGLLIQFLVQGIARATDGVVGSTAPRYAYMVAIFGALTIAALLPRVRTQMHPSFSRSRLVAVVMVAAILPLAANMARLGGWAYSFQQETYETRAYLRLATEHGGSFSIPWDARTRGAGQATIPSPADLNVFFARYGSPLDDPRVSSQPIPQDIEEAALFDIIQPNRAPLDVDSLPRDPRLLSRPLVSDATLADDGACLVVTPSGLDPQMVFHEHGGWALYVQGRPGDKLELYLSLSGNFYGSAMAFLAIGDTGVIALPMPDVGDPNVFVRIDPSADGPSTICAGDPLPVVAGSGSGSATPD